MSETTGGASAPPPLSEYAQFLQQGVDLLKSGKQKEGLHLLDRCLAADPGNPNAAFILGSAHLDMSNVGIAIALLSITVNADPEAHWGWHNLGVALRKAEHYGKARSALLKAYELKPDRVDTMAMLAGSYVNVGDPHKGIDWARMSLKAQPDDNPHAWNNLALALLEAENFSSGDRDWETLP